MPIQNFSHEIVKVRDAEFLCTGVTYPLSNGKHHLDIYLIHVDDNFTNLEPFLRSEILEEIRTALLGRYGA